ncbi:hypothetical protein BHE74_00020229 [Ensete ventricosum]|nr:hypothetical protein GW17_00048771 [Ensete ventricosum]RWW71996.1 hypothetical protein BHE74_00020229 [Ensete ventricosum]
MLLGKRQRPPMRRTTSMTEFAADVVLTDVEATQPPSDHEKTIDVLHHQWKPWMEPQRAAELPMQRRASGVANWLEARYHGSLVLSPRTGGHRRNSADLSVMDTAPFLRACGLCKRRLGPGRDTFMYRYCFWSIDLSFCHKNSIFIANCCSLSCISCRLMIENFLYLHRGDIAFCSLECRQQHINLEERKDKCSLTSIKDAVPAANGSDNAGNGETVAAA